MFLDEKLLQICIDNDADTPEKVQQLNKDLIKECEEYYKSRLNATLTNREVKVILDKTFNLFDSFVRMAKKSNDTKLQILGELFEKFTYRKQFMSNEKLCEVYNKLK